ncbi:MAG: hypothetical protein IPJ88_03700 [Myxococcales bacterium]|nr:MAG: hypothetical protein IPJ88_03700 [Myxococcales bacterium]
MDQREQALAKLESDEKNKQLWGLKLLGYPVWPLLRMKAYHQKLYDKKIVRTSGPEAPLSMRLANVTTIIANDLRQKFSFDRDAFSDGDVWVMTTTNYLRRTATGSTQCMFAGDLLSELGEKVRFVERTTNGVSVSSNPQVVRIDLLHLTSILAGRVVGSIRARFNGSTSEAEVAGLPYWQAYQMALYGKIVESVASRWVDRYQPQAAFVVCGFDAFVAFQRVLRRKGVPLIEFQHGFFNNASAGYVFSEEARNDYVPEHMIVFGRYFGEHLERQNAWWKGKWSVGGHPWIKRAVAGLSEQEKSNTIAFFSQPDSTVREQIRRLLQHMSQNDALKDWQLVLKPHPRENDAEKYWGLLRSDRLSVASNTDDSYALLRRSRAAVSVYSTLAAEALAFQCKSIVLESDFRNYEIQDLINRGYVYEAKSIEDIETIVRRPTDINAFEHLATWLFGIGEKELNYSQLITSLRSQ